MPESEWERAATLAADHYLPTMRYEVDHDDVRQIGLIAAWEASLRYDASKGGLFEWTYGRAYGAMRDAFRSRQYGAPFTRTDLREFAKVERGEPAKPPAVREVWSLDREVTSVRTTETVSLYDLVGSAEDIADETVERHHIYDLLDRLPRREGAIMCLYYIDGYTQEEIAEVLGVDPSRVCQIVKRATLRLHAWRQVDEHPIAV